MPSHKPRPIQFFGGDVKSAQIAQDDKAMEEAKQDFSAAIKGKNLNFMLAMPSKEMLRTAVGFKQANLLEELGANIVGAPAPKRGNPWGQVAWEDAVSFKADVILSEENSRNSIDNIELWQSLPAIKAGQKAAWTSKGRHTSSYYAQWLSDLAKKVSDFKKL